MEELLEAISELVSNTPHNRVVKLAEAVRDSPRTPASRKVRTWAVMPGAKTRVSRLIKAWDDFGIASSELAGMLIGASHAYRQTISESKIELVWSGPPSKLVATKKTEQALLEVINSARNNLFLTSFVTYDAESILSALVEASERGVILSTLLESSDRHGGSVSIDGIAKIRELIPSARVYFWNNKDDQFESGKVHAKVAVCDEALCFISSANLTGHGMEKNMEVGVLIRGGNLPRTLHRHLESLVTINIVQM